MNRLETTLLLSLLTILMVTMGIPSISGMIVAFVIVLGMNFFSYWFSGNIVLKMYATQKICVARGGWRQS